MTTRLQSSSSPNAARDVAQLGLVRPPLVYLISLVTGALIQLVTPLPFLPQALAVPLGSPLVVAAIALFFYAVARFRSAGTPVPARKPTTVIVRNGPYRFSRNLWLLATLVGAAALIHYVVIPTEERYLERRFATEYLTYKASVRRWL